MGGWSGPPHTHTKKLKIKIILQCPIEALISSFGLFKSQKAQEKKVIFGWRAEIKAAINRRFLQDVKIRPGDRMKARFAAEATELPSQRIQAG